MNRVMVRWVPFIAEVLQQRAAHSRSGVSRRQVFPEVAAHRLVRVPSWRLARVGVSGKRGPGPVPASCESQPAPFVRQRLQVSSAPVSDSMIQSPTSSNCSGAVRPCSSSDSRSAVAAPNLRAARRLSSRWRSSARPRRRPSSRRSGRALPRAPPEAPPGGSPPTTPALAPPASSVPPRTPGHAQAPAPPPVPARQPAAASPPTTPTRRTPAGAPPPPEPLSNCASTSSVRSTSAAERLPSRRTMAETRLRSGKSSSPSRPSSRRR